MRHELRTVRLQLAEPLRISRATMAARDAVWFTLEQGGLRGHGEAVSSTYYGLDTGTLARLLTGAGEALRRFRDPESALGALRAGELTGLLDVPPAVTAAAESALLDLAGKRAGLPVYRLLGAFTAPAVATARTIGITSSARAAVQAHCLTQSGCTLLKVKAGSPDPQDDLDRVRAVREQAPHTRLLLDPNGAWSPTQARQLLPRFAALGVEAVEQPVPPGAPEELARLAAGSPLPVIADEDAVSYPDVQRLAGRVHGVNVKLAKCGGVHAALSIAELTAGSDTALMLGCLTASTLGIAPAVHCADRARWADLDGHLLLAQDPWYGIGGGDGTVRAGQQAGLGVQLAAASADLPTADQPPESAESAGAAPADGPGAPGPPAAPQATGHVSTAVGPTTTPYRPAAESATEAKPTAEPVGRATPGGKPAGEGEHRADLA